MATYRTYRRELTPGVVLEARVTEYTSDNYEGGYYEGTYVDHSTLDAFTLTVFGQVQDLLPDNLKGTEEAWTALGEKDGALQDVVDEKWEVDVEAQRKANLQRWGLLPKGKEIVIKPREAA